jgi:drug/metabolite transporter (DMT)-like permease
MQQHPSLTRHIPSLALLLAMILWSSSFIALKIAFRGYSPMVVIFGRMLVASLCFLVVGKRLARSLDYRPGDYKPILFMAFCEPCLYFLFEAKAIENTTASQAGLLTAMLPILVIVAASLLLKEVVSRRAWVGAILAVIGVCWLTAESTPSADAPNPVLGNFYEFLAMVCATGYTISLKKLTSRYSPFFLTAMQAAIGTLFYLPLMFLPGTTLPVSFEPGPAFAIVYLGAVITLGAYGLYNFGLKHVPASSAAMYVNLIPVFSVLLGWLVLDETLSPSQSVAALVVMTGVYLSQQRQPKER